MQKNRYIVTTKNTLALESLNINTSNTPERFKFTEFVYNHKQISTYELNFYYDKNCLNITRNDYDIVFITNNMCQSVFTISVYYNETSLNSSFIVREKNVVLNLEPKLSITDSDIYSDYFPSRIKGGFETILSESVRLTDPFGTYDVTQYFICDYYYEEFGISLMYIDLNFTTNVIVTCNSTYFEKTSSFFINSTDYININGLSGTLDTDTVRTHEDIVILQHMITRRMDGSLIEFNTTELKIPITFDSNMRGFTIFEEQYFTGFGTSNPYRVFCGNNSHEASEISFIVDGEKFGEKTGMFCNNLPLIPDIDLGSTTQQKYKVSKACGTHNCLTFHLVPLVNENIFFHEVSIHLCSVVDRDIFEIVDISNTFNDTSLSINLENIKVSKNSNACMKIQFSRMTFSVEYTTFGSFLYSSYESFGNITVVMFDRNVSDWLHVSHDYKYYRCGSISPKNYCLGNNGYSFTSEENNRDRTMSQYVRIPGFMEG